MSEGWWRRAWKWWTKGSDTTTTSTTELDPNQDLQQPPPPSVAVAASSGSSQSHPSKRRRRRTPQEPPTDGTEPPHDEPGRWSSKNQPGPQDPEGQCTHDDSNNQADRNHVWFQSLDREAPTIQKDSYHDSARNHHPTRGGVARLVSPSSHPEEDEDGAGSTRVEKPAASSTHGNKQKKRQKQMVQRRKRIATAKQQTATKKRKSKRRILEDTSSSSEDDDDDGPRRTNRPPRKKQCRSSSHEKGIKKKKDPETPKPSSPHKATRTRTTTQKCKEDDDDDEDITSPTRRSSLRLQRMFDARRRYARRQQTLFPATPKTDSGSSSEPHGTSSSSPRATPNHRTKESNDDQMALPPKLSLQQPLRKNTNAQRLGRCYYRSLVWSGTEFSVGSVVLWKTSPQKDHRSPCWTVLITGIFQATLSVRGVAYHHSEDKDDEGDSPQRKRLQQKGRVYALVRQVRFRQVRDGIRAYSLHRADGSDCLVPFPKKQQQQCPLDHVPYDKVMVEGHAHTLHAKIVREGHDDTGWPDSTKALIVQEDPSDECFESSSEDDDEDRDNESDEEEQEEEEEEDAENTKDGASADKDQNQVRSNRWYQFKDMVVIPKVTNAGGKKGERTGVSLHDHMHVSKTLGRSYYRHLKWNGRKVSVGSIVWWDRPPRPDQKPICVLITALFRSTRSFQGYNYHHLDHVGPFKKEEEDPKHQVTRLQEKGQSFALVRVLRCRHLHPEKGIQLYSLQKNSGWTRLVSLTANPKTMACPFRFPNDSVALIGEAIPLYSTIRKKGQFDNGWPKSAKAQPCKQSHSFHVDGPSSDDDDSAEHEFTDEEAADSDASMDAKRGRRRALNTRRHSLSRNKKKTTTTNESGSSSEMEFTDTDNQDGMECDSSENESMDDEMDPKDSNVKRTHTLSGNLPPTRNKTNQKSILTRDQSFFDTVGGLRDFKGDDGTLRVSMSDPLNLYSQVLGRVYFRGFKWSGKEFTVGSIIKLCSENCIMITSIFQATKSFENLPKSSKDSFSLNSHYGALQKRGHAYMTFRTMAYKEGDKDGVALHNNDMASHSIDLLPIWLYEPGLSIEHLPKNTALQPDVVLEQNDVRKVGVKDPGWPPSVHARQVHYISQQWEKVRWWPRSKESRLKSNKARKRCKIQHRLTYDSSDDSDAFDSESEHLLMFNQKQRKKHLDMRSKSDQDHIEGNDNRSFDEKLRNVEVAHEEAASCDDSDTSNVTPPERTSHQNQRLVFDTKWPDESDFTSSDSKEREKGLAVLGPYMEAFPELSAEIQKAVFRQEEKIEYEYVDSSSVSSTTQTGKSVDTATEAKLNEAKKLLGVTNLRPLQERVCAHIVQNPMQDVVVNSPCGSGKTMCFMVPTVLCGGITLVVEPLRALIESLFKELRKRNICCEKLRSKEAADYHDEPAAHDRLLTLQEKGCDDSPLVLLTTPELVCSDRAMDLLGKLQDKGKLRRIVMDEYDLCTEHNKSEPQCNREAFAQIVPQIRKFLKNTPTIFLSATASEETVKLVAWHPCQRIRPKVFIQSNPVPDNHCYLVESKSPSLKENAARIARILSEYAKQHEGHPPPKALCYVVYPSYAKQLSKYLSECGVCSREYVRADNEKQKQENAAILEEFKGPKLQVVCANAALGRGVDDLPKNIHFCFHVQMPFSLAEYLQQTGRAGRDGGTTFCYLFYRSEDRHGVSKVLLGSKSKLSPGERRGLDYIMEYGTNGVICRREALASSTLIRQSSDVVCQVGGKILCDNCYARMEVPKNGTSMVTDVTERMQAFLLRMREEFLKDNDDCPIRDTKFEVMRWRKIARNLAACSQDESEQQFLETVCSGNFLFGILHDLRRYMSDAYNQAHGDKKLSELLEDQKSRSQLIDALLEQQTARRFLLQRSPPLTIFSQPTVYPKI